MGHSFVRGLAFGSFIIFYLLFLWALDLSVDLILGFGSEYMTLLAMVPLLLGVVITTPFKSYDPNDQSEHQ